MSDPTPDLVKLEKQLRVLKKKLERSEWHRSDLESQHDRNQHLYRRLQSDLEAAHREAQIETALERVRTQSALMTHSTELVETSAVFHEQLLALGVATEFSYVWLPDEPAGKHQFWATWTEEEGGAPVYRSKAVTYDLDKSEPYTAACFAAWESDDPVHVDFIPSDDIEGFFETWAELLQGAENLRAEHFPEGIYYTEGYMAYGCFGINIREGPTEAERDIIRRFAVEFERAYSRFLDLQKAEAQAREAQIEAALERVRARGMAMHSSDDLAGVVARVFEELTQLDFELTRCVIWIFDEDTRSGRMWMANPEHPDAPESYLVPYHDHPAYLALLDAWRARDPAWVYDLHGDLKATWDEYLFNGTDLGRLPAEVQAGMRAPDRIVLTLSFTHFGALQAVGLEALSDANLVILRRFTRVFDQTYTRFLDIQQAEAQAREAQIEAALERVRSRAMAMRSSDELREMVLVILKEMKALAFPSGRCTIVLFDRDTGDSQFWMSGLTDADLPERYHVPYHELPTYKALHDGWRQGISFFEIELAGEVKREQDRFFHEETEFSRLPEPAKEGMRSMGNLWLSNASTTHGVVQAVGPEPLSADDAVILRRFAKVIDLTYTRVEDIQQSEAQVREAQIEAALERVRSRSLAMQTSDELGELSHELVKQVQALGVDTWHCAFHIYDEGEESSTEWGANADGFYPTYTIPRVGVFERYHAIGLSGADLHVEIIGEDRCAEHYEALCAVPGVGEVLLGLKDSGVPFPESQVDHVAFFEYGYLIFVTFEPAPEAHDIFRRFARVFEQSYTRFLDLKRAEAQARESQIEAAMERVRSRALAMTTSDELLDVVFKIHQEFIGLGLPCEMFWQTRYTPDYYQKALTGVGGMKVSAIMDLPRDFSGVPELAAWERGDEKIGVFPFDADAACQYLHHMVTKGHFHEVDPDGITEEMVRENDGWTFVQARTSHGEIGYALWGETEPTEEAKDVLIRFTSAFDLAYRRFEDLQQAERDHQALLEEKAVTEKTLAELRAMQAQLVQSEKMASLGQLTAGIAHEIKNPLNFVNNFAELSQELVAELEEETNPEERQALLNDLRANAAKIEEHGRRADAIVRAMMEHARSGSGERRPVKFNALVEEYAGLAYHGMRARHPEFEATLDLDLADDAGEVKIEPQEIGRVLINLIDNALDAVRTRAAEAADSYVPTVTVSTKRANGQAEVHVADNGPGMEEAVRAKVFEPFFTTKPTGQGTGLGLSMSYDIVTQGHGGTLAVESAEGEGATFVLALPAD